MPNAKRAANHKRPPRPTQHRGILSKAEPNVLKSTLKQGETIEARQAEFMVEGLVMNAVVGLAFSKRLGALDLTECFAQLLSSSQATTSGNSKSQEAILTGQVISTNAIYTDLAMMARNNLVKGLDMFERLMRLALKAQSNCRATVETLAAMQNPPTVFARQANIANGPQQINNGGPNASRVARAKELDSRPNKLLEAHGEGVDGGTASSTVGRNSQVAAVGKINRTAKQIR